MPEPLPTRLPLLGEGKGWRWLVGGVVGFGGGAAGLAYLGRGPAPAVAGVGFSVGIVCTLLAVFTYFGTRQARAMVAAMARGDYIAYWVVPRGAWRAHLASERAAEPNFILIGVLAGAGIATAVAALVVGIGLANGDDLTGHLWPTLGIVAAATVVFGLVGVAMVVHSGARARQLGRGDGVICVADSGLYHAGELRPHGGGIPLFLGVELLTGPPKLLAFTYRYPNPHGAAVTEVIRIPVPGTVSAESIVARLGAR